LELLIEAFKTLNSDWTLKIIGPADVKAGGGGIQYLEYLKKLASGYRVEFVGPVYDMEILNNYYLDASIFIYPSIAEKGETFGLAPLEAMAYGCVPIVSDLTCFKDFIIHDNNGLIFDHRRNNAIELLAKSISSMQHNNIERYKLAKNAIEVRQSHSTSIIASLFLEEFHRIIEENGHKL
jgi:glycosyltransferase involved in cell wall biosynthesis